MTKKAPRKRKSETKSKTKPPRTPRSKARRREKPGPRSQALPTFEQVRNVKLDHICEAIAEARERKNAAQQAENSQKAKAIEVMPASKVQVYKHAGVELALVPGAAKLRIRLTDDDGDAAVMGGVTTQPQDEQAATPAEAETQG